MTTEQQQAYINGFVKRATEHGLSEGEALALLKSADAALYPPTVPPTSTPSRGQILQQPSTAPAAPNAMPSRGQILQQRAPRPISSGSPATASVWG